VVQTVSHPRTPNCTIIYLLPTPSMKIIPSRILNAMQQRLLSWYIFNSMFSCHIYFVAMLNLSGYPSTNSNTSTQITVMLS